MEIHGLQKTTLLDYPGHLAATVFTGGCNFRCPYCHNSELVLSPANVENISPEDIFSFLEKRIGVLEGLCITGGEPTLQHDLTDFIRRVKSMGFLVKLDTNGYIPAVVQMLLADGLIDYIAMDIKHAPSKYADICHISDFTIAPIAESVHLILSSSIPYEFRTTVVKELHHPEDFMEIAHFIYGAKAYYLQAYQDSDRVMFPGYHSYTKKELEVFQSFLRSSIPVVEIRGLND